MPTPKRKTSKKTKALITYDAEMLDATLDLAPSDEIADVVEDLHDDLLVCYGIVRSASPDATIEDAIRLLPDYRAAIDGMDRGEDEEPEVIETTATSEDDDEFREPGDAPARRRRRRGER